MDDMDSQTKGLRSALELMRDKTGETNPVAAECLELCRAFFKIRDAAARRELLDLAKRLSSN